MTRIAVSFQCDTHNPFSTHSSRATTGINVKMVIQTVGKDPEQNLVGSFDEFRISSGVLHCFKRKNIPPQVVHLVKVEIAAKFSEEVTFSSLLGRKGTLFSSHTMNFHKKLQPFNP